MYIYIYICITYIQCVTYNVSNIKLHYKYLQFIVGLIDAVPLVYVTSIAYL